MSFPTMVKVKSSNVVSVGHDGSDLFVKFNSGETYRYSSVSEKVYNELLAAKSVGSFLVENVKRKGYRYSKIA